jgi:hypothetical protein
MKKAALFWHLSIGLLLLCVVCGSLPASGQPLELSSRTFYPPDDVNSEWTALRNAAEGESVHALIQLRSKLNADYLARLESEGIVIHSAIPVQGYLATIPVALEPSDLAALDIRYVGEILPDDKIHPRAKRGHFGDWSAYTEDRRIFAVTVFADAWLDIPSLMAQFHGEAGPYIRSIHTWILALNPDDIYEFSARDEVKWISELPPPMDIVNDIARQRTHAEQVQSMPYLLSGDGVMVCVYDGGMVDQTHHDFGGRVTLGEGGAAASHATHVAGSVGSSGELNAGQYRGMAPEVEIVSYQYEACNPYCLYNSPQDIEENYEEALNDHGAHLCTNSIGSNIASNGYDCEWEGDYEQTSQLLDAIVGGSLGQPFVVLYAAGNERSNGRCGTTYWTMGVPACAKDIITVGATDDYDNISTFTSWGPTDDGRLKPDVCAPGVNIYSTIPGNSYGNMSGTSMATPITAGCTALIMQKFQQMFSANYRPLPATVKALLCVSADDFGNSGPDYMFGHGRVNVQNAVDYMNIYGFLEGEVAQAETSSVSITVAPGLSDLRVVLAWDDPPGEYLAAHVLVNDLDLELVSPSSVVYLPFTLDPVNPGNPAALERNPRDNVEHVVVANPESGDWVVRVVAYDIPGPILSQTYGLAANVSLFADIGIISGVISDSTTGDPLEGWVEVSGGPQVSYANPNGEYNFYLPGDSTYTLIAHYFGYEPRESSVYLPAGGNVTLNFELPLAAVGTVEGHVYNGFGDPLENATVEVLNTPITPVQTNAQGAYTIDAPGGDTYTLRATWQGLEEEGSVYVIPDSTVTLDFILVDPRILPTGPDNYGYIAYDNHEIENPAVYEWVEIDPDSGGSGTLITLDDDITVPVALPFTFTYYGVDYDSVSICTNGWIACGYTVDYDWSNSHIPDDDGPPAMIAPFWEDLKPADPSSPPLVPGVIAYWYDQNNGRFIVEYNHVEQWTPSWAVETFEVILYDPDAHPTMTGDGNILFQYRQVSDPSECSVGIENHNEDDGLELLCDSSYHPNSWQLEDSLAVFFTTGPVLATGSVAGQVTLVPSGDPTQVTVQVCNRTSHPEPTGTYQIDEVPVGIHSVTATLEGYETGIVTNVEVLEDSVTENVDFELYRLDPPSSLQAQLEDSVVTLWWHSPFEIIAQSTDRGETDRARQTTSRTGTTVNTRSQITPELDNALSGGGSWQLSLENFTLYRDDEAIQTGITDTTATDILHQSGAYDYYVTAVYTGGESDTSNHVIVDYITGVGDEPVTAIPEDFFLDQNYPNPFNPVTRIRFGLPQTARVKIVAYNILGQQVAVLVDDIVQAGYHRIAWDAGNVASGLYFIAMEADNRVWIQKGLLLK